MVDKRDSDKMIQLAREGKQITKIFEEDFPNYDYWEVYWEVYGAGERSSLGAKRMISNRLNKLSSASKNEQKQIIDEIDDLVWHLYSRYKENQQKLDQIRSIINQ
jgi:hypothetical protein